MAEHLSLVLPGPGIHVPEGSTLTIEGNGSLEVNGASTSNAAAVGIGGKGSDSTAGEACGNVLILGGTIIVQSGTATSPVGKSAVDIGGGTSDNGNGGNCSTVIILTSVNSNGNLEIGGGSGAAVGGGKGSDGSGIKPTGDGSYTVWGDLTVPSGVEFPGGITLDIPSGTTLNLPENFNWPENITVTGDGTITPDNKKLPATITLKDDLIFATGNPINLNYTYNGNGQVTITWYEDKDTTQQLQEAPKGGRSYWIVMSAEATNLYQAVSKIEEVEVKKGGQPAEKPTVSQTKAGSITVKTISGQKYICTDSSNPPSIDDPEWIDGTGMEYKFDGLHSNKQYYIHTYFTGNDYLDKSSIIYEEKNGWQGCSV